MVKVDLITGFLGTGKTTFIHKYIAYLHGLGKTVHVIENEFGSVSVDTLMLQQDACSISDLSGACMCCTGKAKFMEMLVQADEDGVDRVVIEPSGIYDVDEFFDVMFSESVKGHCEIGSIITIVDAKTDSRLSEESMYLMFSQLLAAGSVIMSKSQLFDKAEADDTITKLNGLMEHFGSSIRFGDDINRKDWDDYTDADFEAMMNSGYRIEEHVKEKSQHEIIYGTIELADYCEDREDLEKRLHRLFEDPVYGDVIRVKGHIQDLGGQWYEINCSPDSLVIKPREIRKGLFVIIGQELNSDALYGAFISRKKVKAERAAAKKAAKVQD